MSLFKKLFKGVKKVAGFAAPIVGGAYGGPLGAQAGSLFGNAINRRKGQSQQAMQPQAVEVIPSQQNIAPQDFNTQSPVQVVGASNENAGGVESSLNSKLPLIGVGLLAVLVLTQRKK